MLQNLQFEILRILKGVLIICVINIPYNVVSQKNVTIKMSPITESYLQKFKEEGKTVQTVKAWRIQVISTTDRREMELTRSNFVAMYPGVSMDWNHVAPYYQVRVGYFENKNKLMPLLLDIKKTFPSATPVYDVVSKKSIVNIK